MLQISDIPVHELYERFREQFSYELESWAQHAFASRLNRSQYLSFVGIFTLRQCDYNEEYRAGLREFFTEVHENNIHSVIVDLRGNPGGNSRVSNEFIRYLPVENYGAVSATVRYGPYVLQNEPQLQKNDRLEPTFHGDVYVLTSTNTFSSAMYFAMLLSDNGLATLIGEIPGNMPSSYGDILYFQTPNARLRLSVSYKYFLRADASKEDLPLIPDIQVPAEEALNEALRLAVSGNPRLSL